MQNNIIKRRCIAMKAGQTRHVINGCFVVASFQEKGRPSDY
jgi:hypothetical protein